MPNCSSHRINWNNDALVCEPVGSISHPKVYSNGGYKVASQKCPVFKAHQHARLPHGRVTQQHHLDWNPPIREEGQQVILYSLHMKAFPVTGNESWGTCRTKHFATEVTFHNRVHDIWIRWWYCATKLQFAATDMWCSANTGEGDWRF